MTTKKGSRSPSTPPPPAAAATAAATQPAKPTRPRRRRREGNHVVMHGEGVKCLRCGATAAAQFPIGMLDWVTMIQAFAERHRRCKTRRARRQEASATAADPDFMDRVH